MRPGGASCSAKTLSTEYFKEVEFDIADVAPVVVKPSISSGASLISLIRRARRIQSPSLNLA
jgi:hypothetical protein